MDKIEACHILGLQLSEATELSRIKVAYRKQSHLHHPDKGGNTELMAEINEAYQVLTSTQGILQEQWNVVQVSPRMAANLFSVVLTNYLVFCSYLLNLDV